MQITKELRYDMKLKALFYYYKQKMKLADVAQKLGISRVTLNRLLSEAESEGLLRIEIVDVRGKLELIELEEVMRKRFGLRDTIIVDTASPDFQVTVHDVARAAAQYLDGIMHSGIKIAISWGQCLDLMTKYLTPNRAIKGVEVYTLLGGAGIADSQIQPNIIAQNIILKFSGVAYVMNAPFICNTQELCDAIKAEEHIASIITNSAKADVTIVGMGATPDPSLDSKYFHYSADIIDEMYHLNSCGDICSNFYDIFGNKCPSPVHGRFVSIDIANLRSHKLVMGIAGGDHKVASILGALNGHYLDVLVTDKRTALQVLELAEVTKSQQTPTELLQSMRELHK